jgi:hypothetical protein
MEPLLPLSPLSPLPPLSPLLEFEISVLVEYSGFMSNRNEPWDFVVVIAVTRNKLMTRNSRCPEFMLVGNRASKAEAFKSIVEYFKFPVDFREDRPEVQPLCSNCNSPIHQV